MSWHTHVESHAASAKGRIRCLLAHDHVLLRQGVRRLLEDEPDFEVVAEAGSGSEALKKVHEHRPDVVLIDAGMRGLSAADPVRQIQKDCPATRLIFLSTRTEEEAGRGAQAGPHGYLPKDTPAPELISLLRGNYSNNTDAAAPYPSEGPLTTRERQVLQLIAEGHTARKIARLLSLSIKTVEAHKFNLMRKLNIHNKAQLVTYAIQKQIVKMPVSA